MPPSDQVVVAAANFSAQQILEAGRRAEADGNRDHAVRFYKHLTIHFAGTFEAADAVAALHRLEDAGPRYAFAPPAPAAGSERTSPHLSVSGVLPGAGRPAFATPLLGPPVSPGPLTLDGDMRLRVPASAPRAAQPPERGPERGPERAADRPAGETTARPRKRKQKAQELQENELAAPALPRYRVGRFLAGFLTIAGGLGAVFALGALIAGSLLPAARTANTLASAVLASPAMAGGLTLAALVVLLVGQMARAVFALVLHQRHADKVHGQPDPQAPDEHD
jgi:hypothetical protein